jgi:Colicin E5 ribonuclease domain
MAEIGTKIEGQLATRGWSQAAIEATVKNPEATHAVWDLTSGIEQAATAYVQRGGGYVVVNDRTGAVVMATAEAARFQVEDTRRYDLRGI